MPASRKQHDEHDHGVHNRCLLAVGALVALFGGISARLVFVQHVQHDKWSAQMNAKREVEILPAARGPIFDSKFRVLACDEMVESVVFDNVYLSKKSNGAMERMARTLADAEQRPWVEIRRAWSDDELRERYVWWLANVISGALDRPPAEISKAILERTNSRGEVEPDRGETILAKEISATQAGELRTIMEKNPLACLHVRATFRRSYPTSRPLTHLVGLINANGPVCGVEASRQDVMKGEPGRREYEVDVRKREVAAFRGEFVEPRQGKALKLTIDTAVQEILEQLLDETGSDPDEIYVPALKAKRVSVVLLDAKTMAVLASAYRCEELTKEGRPLLFNPAAQEPYEPGSTMKIMTVAAALDTGKVDSTTIIPTSNGYYDDADVEPIHDDHGYAQLSVTDILVHSSNIGAYKLSRTVGLKRFREYILGFGFGARTGVECPNESRGILHPVEKWNYNAMSRASFGYGIAVTPLQMCAALGVILNDGCYKQPYMVEAVLDASANRVLEETKRPDPRRVISSRTAKAVREALFQVVERGTGRKAQSKDYEIAGKTGTARLASKNGYASGQYIVSFLGYAPANNPQFLGLVVVDTPQGEAQTLYGGAIAAPLFRRMMEACLRYYQVPAGEVAHNTTPPRR